MRCVSLQPIVIVVTLNWRTKMNNIFIFSVITSLTHRNSNNYIVSTLNYCGCGYSAVESHIYENIGGVMKCECGHVM